MEMFLISLAVGVLIGFLVVGGMKRQLTTVRRQESAFEYLTPGSLNLTVSTDLFLYENTTRTPKPKSNRK